MREERKGVGNSQFTHPRSPPTFAIFAGQYGELSALPPNLAGEWLKLGWWSNKGIIDWLWMEELKEGGR